MRINEIFVVDCHLIVDIAVNTQLKQTKIKFSRILNVVYVVYVCVSIKV